MNNQRVISKTHSHHPRYAYGYVRQLGCKKQDPRCSPAGVRLLCSSLVCPPTVSPPCCLWGKCQHKGYCVQECLCFPHLCRKQKTCPLGQRVTMAGTWGKTLLWDLKQGVFSKWPHLNVARTLGQGSGCGFQVRHLRLLAT